MLLHYIKLAIRSSWRHKGFTFINVLGLSIGIALLGVFGLVALSIQKRTREIGIRKVIGANPFFITYYFGIV